MMDGLIDAPAPVAGIYAEEKKPERDPAAEEFVTAWLTKIDESKKHHEEAFERMREDIRFAAGIQWVGQTKTDDRYVADITQNILRQRVAALYAKNPVVVAKRRKRLDFSIWDESLATLQAAMQNPMDPSNMMLLQDVTQGAQYRKTMDSIAKTLEIAFHHQLGEQKPDFKRQLKQLVRRTDTTGVGYMRLDFHRAMSVSPEINQQINDYATQLSYIEQLISAREEGEFTDQDKEAEKLRIAIQSLEQNKYILIREGLQLSFPRSTALIPDKNCTQLEGWLGAGFLAEEFYMSGDEIKRLYKIDPKDFSGTLYTPLDQNGYKIGASPMSPKTDAKGNGFYCVYLVYDLETSSCFTICRGYCDYLVAPAAPGVKLERFFPYFALTFNDREDENCIFPHSTVRLIMHQQREYNRAKEALRQHRIASKPLYASAVGALDEADKGNIAQHDAHECIEIQTLQEGQDVATKFQMVKKHAIDQNVYETNTIFADITRVAGFQPADLGAIAGATATETSLAEDSRSSSVASNSDDLDDFLSAFAKEAGHVIMTEFSAETIVKIVGPGAVWPEFSGADVANDIYLEVAAGSSGRPNKAAKAAAVERLYPLLIQLPGINPEWVVKLAVDIIDDNVDISDAYIEGLPSLMMLNKPAPGAGAVPTGNPQNDPQAQGAQGVDNAPAPPEGPGGGQGAMPAASAMESAPQRAGGIMGAIRGMMGR